MTLYRSDRFVSTAVSGGDWREVVKIALQTLESALAEEDPYNVGFIYMTDDLADDAESILGLLRSVTNIERWVGMAAHGVCGTGVSYTGHPALSVMLGRIKEEDFCIFPALGLDETTAPALLESWEEDQDSMLILVHGDSVEGVDMMQSLVKIEQLTSGFIVGGLSSSHTSSIQIADGLTGDGVSGVVLSKDVVAITGLTQGCAPLGPVRTITRCQDNIITELDGQRAFDVFSEDLKSMAQKKTGHSPDHVKIKEDIFLDPHDIGPTESMFRGEVHVAFPVSGADQRDYMVRNIMAVDPDEGCLMVAQTIQNGDHMLFVHRDDDTMQADLSRMLLEIRERAAKETGQMGDLAGALYISCAARAQSGEMALVREVLGDIPLAGFYAGGEISNRRLYSYSGIIILFL